MIDKLIGKVVLFHRGDSEFTMYLITDDPYPYYSGGTVNVETVRNWIDKGAQLSFYSRD